MIANKSQRLLTERRLKIQLTNSDVADRHVCGVRTRYGSHIIFITTMPMHGRLTFTKCVFDLSLVESTNFTNYLTILN